MSISKRNSHNYINDVDIAVQRADTAALEVGVSERRYKAKYVILSCRRKAGGRLVRFPA